MEEDYKRLIEDFCASQGIDDVGALLHRGFIDIDEVSMKFEYLDASKQCRVLADLGEIPSGHESELRGLMLENNFSEGNYAMPNLLAGSRAEEKRRAEAVARGEKIPEYVEPARSGGAGRGGRGGN